jgi:mannose-1-phosphate guanylyltransferase
MVLKAMVMAAGVGSRLDPLTKRVPKPLVPVANQPVMDILLKKLAKIGVKDVIANTHYLAEQIVSRYEKNNLGINFKHIQEDTLSGTAGGVKKCQFFFDKNENFLVLSADGLTNADLEFAITSHEKSGAIASIGIKKVREEEIPNFGVVVTDGNGFVSGFQEKPAIEEARGNSINTGIYVFNYKIFDYIPENTFFDFAKNVFPTLLKNNIKINTFPVNEYWSDIGTINQYFESTKDLFDGKCTIGETNILESKNGQYISCSQISAPNNLIGFNTIGSNCSIGKNSTLENCIIWNDVTIKDNISLKNCIIASGNIIEKSFENTIIGEDFLLLNKA